VKNKKPMPEPVIETAEVVEVLGVGGDDPAAS